MRVQIGDARLFFDVEGAKLRADGFNLREMPTVLLLHGGPGLDHSTLKPDFAALAEVAQVIHLDHRGNGRSDRGNRGQYNLAQWGDDVRAVCEALEIEHPIVIGVSFGGMVAMAYATRHPEHPGKLVLSNTAARMLMDRSLAMFEHLGGPEAREAAGRFFENPGSATVGEYMEKCFSLYTRKAARPETFTRAVMNVELMYDFFAHQAYRFDFLPELARIKCPTLIVAGMHDPITPLEDSKDIAAAMAPGLARLEIFEDSGHGPYLDEPERFFRVLKDFILS